MPRKFLLAAVAGMMSLAGTAHAAGDVEAGKQVFRQCALCHTNEPGKNKIGPSLFGVVGRESGSISNYTYSDGMKNFKHVWTPQELDVWLTDPRKLVPGTKMIFPGLKSEKDRQNVIAYLETLK